jgi:uncharacterized protein
VRVWVDLANSPHVPLFQPIVTHLRARGWEVELTARDHAQTLALARGRWPEVTVVGGESPDGRVRKGVSIAKRARELRRLARRRSLDVALSHGSYAQIVAARAAGVPAVTMMDYEHQPANHLSFRLARRVIVPRAFPDRQLRRFGAGPGKVIRYEGFKEELYLRDFTPDRNVLTELALEPQRVIAVFRPPPEGALYHRHANARFTELLHRARERDDVQVVLLPRTGTQSNAYRQLADVVIPPRPVDGRSLLAWADVAIGAGGTMNRESALLGTPTYTVFAGPLAAVDRELIHTGRLRDLRDPGSEPVFEKKGEATAPPQDLGDGLLRAVTVALEAVTR